MAIPHTKERHWGEVTTVAQWVKALDSGLKFEIFKVSDTSYPLFPFTTVLNTQENQF